MLRFLVAITVTMVFTSTTLSAQDIAEGEQSWNKCRSCHQVGEDARNGVGPQLNGMFGRTAGTVEGYDYSDATKNSEIIWDDVTFAEFITDPRNRIPGTKKVFAGIRDEQEIRDLTAFLRQFSVDGPTQ